MTNENPSPINEPKPARRRWFQFSLRTALILITAVCVLLGLWIVPSERQRRAANSLERLGGLYLLHGEENGLGIHWPNLKLMAKRRWYDHYFASVHSIRLFRNEVTDFSAFPQLKRFVYTFGGLDYREPKHILARQQILASLARHNTALVQMHIIAYLEEYELKTLAAFTQLEELELFSIHPKEPSALDGILTLKKLRGLKLAHSTIDNESLKKLDSLPNLECLGIEVSGPRPMPLLKILSEFKHVKHLNIYTWYGGASMSMREFRAILKEYESSNHKEDILISLINKAPDVRLKKEMRTVAGMTIYE